MKRRITILGAGPAGLAAAWQLQRQGKAEAMVVEQNDCVGGNAGSFELGGIPVDYGSHRLHPACPPDILGDLRALLGSDLLKRPRHGRIRLCGRWIHFPLQPLDLISNLPWSFTSGIAGDTIRRLTARSERANQETFASVLERGLGRTICHQFYFPYATKIWGLRPEQLSAVQARRRVSAGSLSGMARKALASVPGLGAPTDGWFLYPRGGYGQISRSFADAAQKAGATIALRSRARALHLGNPHRLEVESDGVLEFIEAEHIWSTIPIAVLARITKPAAPDGILEAAARIRSRAMVLVYLVLAQSRFSEYDAHYFPAADILLTRLSEPKNYSGLQQPADRTVLCAEIPCDTIDAVWSQSPDDLERQVRDALAQCGLPLRAQVLEVAVRRLTHAYPIYECGYEAPFRLLDEWVDQLPGVLTLGRQGLFAHDNAHHTLAMAYAAVECLDGSGHFDRERWRRHRAEFEAHVVED